MHDAPGRLAAWSVHVYTASGAVLGLLSLQATLASDYRAAFLWLAAATFVDATDGWLARWARVSERVPGVDGALLDNIVDYLTYVFVPAVIMLRAGILPGAWGWATAGLLLVASGLGFSRSDAKSVDHFFTGFPSYWNIVAVYLYVLGLPALVNVVIVVALSALVFVPIGYIYPSRTAAFQRWTLSLGGIWAVLMVAMIWTVQESHAWLVAASLVFPAYYTVVSFVLHARRSRGPMA